MQREANVLYSSLKLNNTHSSNSSSIIGENEKNAALGSVLQGKQRKLEHFLIQYTALDLNF